MNDSLTGKRDVSDSIPVDIYISIKMLGIRVL